MTYFLLGFGTAFLSIFIPTIIGIIIEKDERIKAVVLSLACSVVYGIVLWFIFWENSVGVYGPAPLLFPVIGGCLISSFVTSSGKGFWPGVSIVALVVVYLIGVLAIDQSDMLNAKGKVALSGEVEIVNDLNKVMEPADTAHICLVSEDMARVKAQDALSEFKISGKAIPGSRYKIGDATKLYVDGQLWWIYPVEFQDWLKWKEDPQVPGYFRVSAQNPFAEAQAVQRDRNGKDIHIKYLNSACFEFLAERHVRSNGFLGKILDDWTFEPDDNWRPYYTVSILERKFGFEGYKVTGILVFDVQTGELQAHALDNLPSWIDRVQPLGKVVDYNAKKWGRYANATWWRTIWKKDMSQKPTDGWFMTYSTKGYCQWFSGFTSFSDDDDALTGLYISNARTGKVTFLKAKGVTEEVAYQTAISLWKNFDGYIPTELVPYNIAGRLTYVVPITFNGQFKGLSLVSIKNKDINAKGETLNEALNNYSIAIANAGGKGLAPIGKEVNMFTINGVIERVGQPIMIGKKTQVPVMLQGVAKIFMVVYAPLSPEIVVAQSGDEVSLSYLNTRERVIISQSFDVLNIDLSDENPTQSRYEEKQKDVYAEMDRVDSENRKEALLRSDRMDSVDPKALEDFLRSQEKK